MNSDERVLRQPALIADHEKAAAFDRLARRLVLQSLAGVVHGRLVLVEGRLEMVFGAGRDGLVATLRVHSFAFYRRIALAGTIGAGEAYMDGLWSSDDLPALIRIMVRNREVQDRLESGVAQFAGMAQRLLHRLNDNTLSGSRRNIAAHYDLGNDFYRLFLDPTMAYSCGVFERPESTLHEASLAKFDRICTKLGLAAGMTVMEVGTGWGGVAQPPPPDLGGRGPPPTN
jgi:cyclopropane-fatty-acyl-phospholipid synthase